MTRVHDNLRNLGLDVLDVVNLRVCVGFTEPPKDRSRHPLTVARRTQATGIDPSYRSEQHHSRQIGRGSNHDRDSVRSELLQCSATETTTHFIVDLAAQGIAYVPFFPARRVLSATIVGAQLRPQRRLDATPMQIALAWLLQRSPNILLIPGTSSLEHLRENLQSSMLQIAPEKIADLDAIATRPTGSSRSSPHRGRRSPE